MRPIELIPESIDVTNNGTEPLRLPYGVAIAPGATATVALYKYTGGPTAGAGQNSAGVSFDPVKLDPQVPVATVVGVSEPGPTPGIPAGAGAPRAGYTGGTPSSANSGPVHIHGDSPRQRLWNAICAAVQDGLASGQFVSAIALVAPGSGYVAGNVLTVTGGVFATPATIMVDTVDTGGEILTAHLVTGGSYSTPPTNPAAVSGGAGTLATFTLTMVSKVVSLANQVVGAGQPNLAVGDSGGYFGAELDYQTPWQKRATGVDTGVRSVDGTVGFNAPPRGGAAVVGIIPR